MIIVVSFKIKAPSVFVQIAKCERRVNTRVILVRLSGLQQYKKFTYSTFLQR